MYYARFYVVKNREPRELGYDDHGFVRTDTLNPKHLQFPIPSNTVKIDFYDESRQSIVQRAFLKGEVWSEESIAYLDNYDAYMKKHGATNCVFIDDVKRPFLANENDLLYDPRQEAFRRVGEITALRVLEDPANDEDEPQEAREIREDEGEAIPDNPPPDIRDRIIVPRIEPIVPERQPEKHPYIPGITGPMPRL